jgi:hypothetical protein
MWGSGIEDSLIGRWALCKRIEQERQGIAEAERRGAKEGVAFGWITR